MTKCFSLTETRNRCHRSKFTGSGLRSTTTDLKDGTIMHCWVPKTRTESKPSLLLIHGIGPNALWQWGNFIRNLTKFFNVYVPDLIFFGGSYTTRPERTEGFQAECVMRVMKEMKCVRSVSVVGLSYGGFVAYDLAVKYEEFVERVVVCGSGVSLEEKDIKEGLFLVSDLDEAAQILVPQTPQRLRELVEYTFSKASLVAWLPSCFLLDFIHVSLFYSFYLLIGVFYPCYPWLILATKFGWPTLVRLHYFFLLETLLRLESTSTLANIMLVYGRKKNICKLKIINYKTNFD